MSAATVPVRRRRPLTRIGECLLARVDELGVLIIREQTPGGVSYNVRLTFEQWAAVQAMVDSDGEP